MKVRMLMLVLLSLLPGCKPETGKNASFEAMEIRPSAEQLCYQQMEMVGFIHFTVNTFTDKEWGFGDEDPAIFDPTEPDVEQWVITAKNGGLKELILTAKHHDGFCLWPSAYTEHSVKNSPYKDGKGDIVKEFTDACRKHGLKVGLYLSPWDRNHAAYGSDEYIRYFRDQLTELLTQYGEINEIWFDGANGGTGYYGGAREERQVDRASYYEWNKTFELVKRLQPHILIFSDAGPDIHWIGNENGFAGETFWSTISDENLVIGASDQNYLNKGDPEGSKWMIGQCDVSIRPGWFYHQNQDSLVKSPDELMDIYFKSVGRNAVLLLNLPPDRRGLIHENDAQNLEAFHERLENNFEIDLAEHSKVIRKGGNSFIGKNLVSNIKDDNPETFFIIRSPRDASIELILKEKSTINSIMLQEPIKYGQRISKFHVEAQNQTGEWKEIVKGTTIGYKRILLFEAVLTDKIRIHIDSALHVPAISEVGLYNVQ